LREKKSSCFWNGNLLDYHGLVEKGKIPICGKGKRVYQKPTLGAKDETGAGEGGGSVVRNHPPSGFLGRMGMAEGVHFDRRKRRRRRITPRRNGTMPNRESIPRKEKVESLLHASLLLYGKEPGSHRRGRISEGGSLERFREKKKGNYYASFFKFKRSEISVTKELVAKTAF